jgi:3-hydroxy-9,10-secoandrosta-1,3,5(10)-triene-9,17-dione monooxygenase
MALTADTSAPGFPAPPEPGLTQEEVVARAQALATTLVSRQAEAERRTFYAEDIHEELARNGFYRLLVPRRYGGYEFGIETFLRVSMALARGCPSTGWMYCLAATHAVAAATLFGEQAQAELFSGGDFICPATIVPGGSAERGADGDWLINGTWPYCSGSPYATHFMGHALVSGGDGQPPAPMLFIAPRSQWRRLDDWGRQLGLKGSGSHSITIEGGRVPGYLGLPGVHISEIDISGGTPGRALHDNPEYGGGPLSYMNMEIAALAVGMAYGALDVYEDLLRQRTTLLPPIVARGENADYQLWHGEAVAMIATAEAALSGAVRQWHDLCTTAGAFTREQDLRLSGICRYVIKLCWGAVQTHLFPTAGSSSVRDGERLERVWRDLSTLHSHSGLAVFLPTIALRELSRARLGIGR